jgi:hypothetical protein
MLRRPREGREVAGQRTSFVSIGTPVRALERVGRVARREAEFVIRRSKFPRMARRARGLRSRYIARATSDETLQPPMHLTIEYCTV